MTLRKVYIHYREAAPESEMCSYALHGFRERGVETAPFYGFGDVKRLLDLGPEVGVVGYIGDVWEALLSLGIPIPPSLDYPDELDNFLGRRIRRAKLGDVRTLLNTNHFVKPVKQKLFTGFVCQGGIQDQIRLNAATDEDEVWVSEVIPFVSEYRCCILRGEILGAKHYHGDWSVAPDRGVVEAMVEAWVSKPAACTVDVGVTEAGKTILVEVNDGFSFGCYGLTPTLYAQMLEARWEELTSGLVYKSS